MLSVVQNGQSVDIHNGRFLGSMAAESPALALARTLAEQHSHLQTRAYKAAMLVDAGYVAIRPGPYNVYDPEQNITGRVLSQTGSGRVYTIRLKPGSHFYLYQEPAVESCECPDFGRVKRNGIPTCKHVEAVAMARRLLARNEELRPIS